MTTQQNERRYGNIAKLTNINKMAGYLSTFDFTGMHPEEVLTILGALLEQANNFEQPDDINLNIVVKKLPVPGRNNVTAYTLETTPDFVADLKAVYPNHEANELIRLLEKFSQ